MDGAHPRMREVTAAPRPRLLAVLVAAGLAGCGGSSAAPRPSGPAVTFPTATATTTLNALRAGRPESYVLAPSVSLLAPGDNRFGFALLDPSHRMIENARVALYVAAADGTQVRGPFPAAAESLFVKPAYESRTVASDPGAAHAVYVAHIPVTRGKPIITALASVNGRIVSATEDQFQVPQPGAQPPQVGQRAIVVHTPTLASVGGVASRIDTRVPPATDLQQLDLAGVVGRRPVVLVFATPQLCQSRVCGPVVDIAEQVKASSPPDVAFIHVEIYRNNTVADGFLGQVAAWRLPTEPWTFVIDRTGVVRARFEGALSAGELTAAVRGVA